MTTTRSRFGLVLLLAAALAGCNGTTPEVVVYTSVDDVFARPIAQRFEEETGIVVRLVPDTEETKSTGLVNRLLAERQRPQADVFWSGDPVRAAILKANGVTAAYRSPSAADLPEQFSDPDGHWTGFSARARVLVFNRERVSDADAPGSVMDLLAPRFARQTCLANPLFGTTSMHAAALFEVLGEAEAEGFFDRFIDNGGRIVSSNGEVRRLVATGDCWVGLTDTDDANVARQEGRPVGIVYPDQDGIGALIIPNAAVLINHAPHPEQARQFIDYLLRPDTERALAESDAAQMPVRSGVEVPDHVRSLDDIQAMHVDYAQLATMLDRLSAGFLQRWVDAHAVRAGTP